MAIRNYHQEMAMDYFELQGLRVPALVLSTDETAQIDSLADDHRIVNPALAPSWDAA